MTTGASAAFWGFLLALVTAALWFRRAYKVSLPENRLPFVIAMGAAAALGLRAFALGVRWFDGLLAGAAVLAGGVFVLLYWISAQKGSTGAFRVGQPVPDLTAPDDSGQPFSLSRFAGKPLLLKFFRGHW